MTHQVTDFPKTVTVVSSRPGEWVIECSDCNVVSRERTADDAWRVSGEHKNKGVCKGFKRDN